MPPFHSLYICNVAASQLPGELNAFQNGRQSPLVKRVWDRLATGSVCSPEKIELKHRMSGKNVQKPPRRYFSGCGWAKQSSFFIPLVIGSLFSRPRLFSEMYCLSLCNFLSFLKAEALNLEKVTPILQTCKLCYYQKLTNHHPVLQQFFLEDVDALTIRLLGTDIQMSN